MIRQLIDTLRYRGVIGELAGGAASSLPKVTGVGTPLTPEQWVEWFKANRDRDKVVAEYRDQVAALKRSSSGGDKAMKEAMYKSQDLRDAIGKAKRKFKDPGELDTLYWELDKLAREWDAKTKHIKEEDLEKND